MRQEDDFEVEEENSPGWDPAKVSQDASIKQIGQVIERLEVARLAMLEAIELVRDLAVRMNTSDDAGSEEPPEAPEDEKEDISP